MDDMNVDNDEGEDWRSEEEQARVDQIEDNAELSNEGEDDTDDETDENDEEEIELSSETIGELRRKFDIFKQDAE